MGAFFVDCDYLSPHWNDWIGTEVNQFITFPTPEDSYPRNWIWNITFSFHEK
jgi:hypothetical protein